jgi:hypothetical protein
MVSQGMGVTKQPQTRHHRPAPIAPVVTPQLCSQRLYNIRSLVAFEFTAQTSPGTLLRCHRSGYQGVLTKGFAEERHVEIFTFTMQSEQGVKESDGILIILPAGKITRISYFVISES